MASGGLGHEKGIGWVVVKFVSAKDSDELQEEENRSIIPETPTVRLQAKESYFVLDSIFMFMFLSRGNDVLGVGIATLTSKYAVTSFMLIIETENCWLSL